ncbi:MAG TPA: hypothetical protein VIH99_06380 [Bdellovibrionota bacterium]
MRALIFCFLVLAISVAHAKPSKEELRKKHIKLTPPGQKAQTTQDPGSATRLLFEDPRNKNSPTAGADKKMPKSAVKGTCADTMGMIYKQGDTGYEGCLRTENKTRPALPGDDKHPNSIGFTIGQ